MLPNDSLATSSVEDPEPRTAITACLKRWSEGDGEARERLFELVYQQLRGMAHRALQRERADHTLATTDLVHEAYFRLLDLDRIDWQDRAHFFRIASQAMRWILVDYARRRGAAKRGRALHRVPLLDEVLTIEQQAETVLAVDEALSRLNQVNTRLAEVVQLRFFGGLSENATAETLGVSIRTVRRDWIKARGWLYRELAAADGA